MTEKEINDVKRIIAKHMEKQFAGYVGMPLDQQMFHTVKAHLQVLLKDLLRETNQPIMELLDVDVSVHKDPRTQVQDKNMLDVVLKAKPGLSDDDHRRAVRFLNGEEFW